MNHLISLLICLSFCQIGYNQIPESELPKFQEKGLRLVESFTESLSVLVTTTDQKLKDVYIKNAISRFQKDATIEVSNGRTGDISSYQIEDYVRNTVVKYTVKYKIVVISFEAIELSKFKEKKDENGNLYYECKFKFVQVFSAAKDQLGESGLEGGNVKWSYVDRTKKKGRIIVKETYGPTGKEWQVSLGDIEVEETELLN